MPEVSESLLKSLCDVLVRLQKTPYPHVPNPEGCKKRASVAVILRIRPAYRSNEDSSVNTSAVATSRSTPQRSSGNTIQTETSQTSDALSQFFAQKWVQDGDPEVLFIKRAGRAGDRWSGHTA